MNNNLPQIYKESFLVKIINKLKVFFSKIKREKKMQSIEIPEVKKSFLKNLKVDFDISDSKEYQKRELMKSLSKNPKLLNNFSNDKLERILKYYIEENEKKREQLEKLAS